MTRRWWSSSGTQEADRVKKPFRPPTKEQVAKYMAELEKADWCDVLPDEEYDDDSTSIIFFREKTESED
jgi:hypothetical protein